MTDRFGLPRTSNPRDLELAIKLSTVRIGIWSTLLVCAGVAAYAATTLDAPNRGLIALLLLAGALSVIPVSLSSERMVAGRWRDPFFLVWTLSDIALLSVLVAADGGVTSPLVLLLVLPLLFGAMSYPLWMTATAGVFSIACFIAIVASTGESAIYGSVGSFALVCATLMAAWESNNQAHRRHELTESLAAREESERRSRIQATQQEEVAVLGQRALGGADIESLFDEAVGAVSRLLEVDVASVLRIDAAGEAMSLAATVGLDDLAAEGIEVPAASTLSSHALETGQPVTVDDWATETRFELPAPMRDRGLVSAICVPIGAGRAAHGTLVAHTTEPREFSPQDQYFMVTLANVLGNAVDSRKREQQMRHDALHDPLTGLANRTLFVDRLRRALARARRRQTLVGVLFLDLDDFKLVNDTLGHDAGDELIRAIAPRLVDCVRVTDTVARFGGDEFTVLIEDVSEAGEAQLVAERIIDQLSSPYELRGRKQHVSASVGIAVAGGEATPESLMRDADTALYSAKADNRGSAKLFDGETRARVVARVQTESDLREALARDEFELYYQPVVEVGSGRTAGLEALIRWQHPSRGTIPPSEFIPLAEEAGLIGEIGAWVIEEACREAARWQRQGEGRGVAVEVNLSALQLKDSHLPETVARAIADAGIEPQLLQLELTESLLLEDSVRAEQMLLRLREIGVGLILDDFGTGYSSLGYLKRLPLNAIKLDRTFIESIADNSPDAAIVAATAELARALGLDVIAEGVETAEQLEAVTGLGCHYAQGYYFSRAVRAERLPEVLGHLAGARP